MTDREKAIVMAHTGICMLAGDKFRIFHEYVEHIMHRPIMTHEMAWLEDAIKERSKDDFIALCKDESPEKTGYWIKHNNEGVITIECPVCRKEYLRLIINYFNYCPFCGEHLLEKDTKGIYRKKGETKDETNN